MGLAGLEERAKRYDEAIVQYRAVLAYARNQVIALNNLAYLLAVQKGAPEEALPLAQRAAAIHGNVQNFEEVLRLVERASTRNVNINVSTVLDTVAWIQHLLGRPVEAARTMAAAISGAPADDVDMFWHAAVIFSDANDRERALLMLQNALRLNSSLLERPEVRALRQHLTGRT